ncbi:MAG: HAMP domain-containing histidine kinase [Gammaproteobacteria bacterium]|jgi:signal transduction histidine kinase|nr:HAMP domain-containing histidine kinase [Gammaproteobacteria bacterium]
MKRCTNINSICFNASFWPAFIIVVLSIALSGLLFHHHTKDIIKREHSRHELINQLLTKAATTDIIIGNNQALYVTLNDFKKKYKLDALSILDDKDTNEPNLLNFLQSQSVQTSWAIPGLTPTKYICIHSKIDNKTILLPFLTSMGIILLFISASIVMYRRIKQKLHSQIVAPLNQTLNCNGKDLEWFDMKSAASEIVVLYNKTNDFIQTLHQQRDTIEEQNVKQAKYNVALQVAHDIRSPVLALKTINQICFELNFEAKELIQCVTDRISEIADDILKEHQPDIQVNANQKYSEAKAPISKVVKMLFEEKKVSCPNKEIKFELLIDNSSKEKYPTISEHQLNRILSNIIDNSIQAIQNTGLISLIVISNTQYTWITLSDTGFGIPSGHLEDIFKEGFSLNKEDGKGLGLSSAKKLIEKNGGNIEVSSIGGKGTTIKLTLKNVNSTQGGD